MMLGVRRLCHFEDFSDLKSSEKQRFPQILSHRLALGESCRENQLLVFRLKVYFSRTHASPYSLHGNDEGENGMSSKCGKVIAFRFTIVLCLVFVRMVSATFHGRIKVFEDGMTREA